MRRESRSAQALLELAVMSTAVFVLIGVLISYGMTANFNDHVRMTTFRKAVALARQRGTVPHEDFSTSLTVIQDRFVPSPGAGPGVAQPVGTIAGSSVAWTNKMYTVPSPREMDEAPFTSVPRLDFEVNGVRTTYTAARWRRLGPYPWGALFLIQEEVVDPGETAGIWWHWKQVTAGEKDPSGGYYIDGGKAADIDGDGTVEQIIAISRDCPQENNCRINLIVFIDPNDGQIDTGYTDESRPWVQGGLSPESEIRQRSEGTFTRDHGGSSIHTQTSITNRGSVVRRIIAGEKQGEITLESVAPEVNVDFSYDGNF